MWNNLKIDNKKCRNVTIICFIVQLIFVISICGVILDNNHTVFFMDQSILIHINFLCLILSTIILYGFIRQDTYDKAKMCYILLGVVIAFALIVDIYAWVFARNDIYDTIQFVFIMINIMLDNVIGYLFYLFLQFTYFNEGKKHEKTEFIIVNILLILGILLALGDFIFHYAYYTDADGYTRIKLLGTIILSLPALSITAIIVLSIKNAKVIFQEKMILLFYLIPPIFSFAKIFVELNSNITYYSVLFSVYLFIFCNLVVAREKQNMKNEIVLAGNMKELKIASDIQLTMLPTNYKDYSRYNLDIYSFIEPAKEVCGDFYDYFMIDEERLAIVIADVSEKGVPASLFMAIGKTLISKDIAEGKSLPDVLSSVHRTIQKENSRGMFITAFVGIIDLENNTLTYTNAGHCFPLVKSGGGEFRYLKETHGTFIGCKIYKNIKYDQSVIKFEKDDTLLLYTDGVTEAKNVNNELYGCDNLLNYINCTNKHVTSKNIVNGIMENIKAYMGNSEQYDDITLLCIKKLK